MYCLKLTKIYIYIFIYNNKKAVHLMQPPFLVNADGNPYEFEYQRLVPGREHLTEAQLNPHVITNENGLPEIVSMDLDEEGTAAELQRRRGNLFVKNLIAPIDGETIRTSEEKRTCMLNVEEDYFIEEYKKELKLREMRVILYMIYFFVTLKLLDIQLTDLKIIYVTLIVEKLRHYARL